MENTISLSRSAPWTVEPGRAGSTRIGEGIWRQGGSQGLMGCLGVEVLQLGCHQRNLGVLFLQGLTRWHVPW